MLGVVFLVWLLFSAWYKPGIQCTYLL